MSCKFRLVSVIALLILISAYVLPHLALAATLQERLVGRILLDVVNHGEGWYVSPVDHKKYFLGKPQNAFELMRRLGLGVKNTDLAKIPSDTDTFTGDMVLRKKLSGRILVQVESHGEAWYVYPGDMKRYYLGRPADALVVMSKLGLGVTTATLSSIAGTFIAGDHAISTSATSTFTVAPTAPTQTPIPSATPGPVVVNCGSSNSSTSDSSARTMLRCIIDNEKVCNPSRIQETSNLIEVKGKVAGGCQINTTVLGGDATMLKGDVKNLFKKDVDTISMSCVYNDDALARFVALANKTFDATISDLTDRFNSGINLSSEDNAARTALTTQNCTGIYAELITRESQQGF